jgi:deoxyribose-phosphate aldolase
MKVIWKFVEKVNSFDGSNPEMDNVAAICVYPNFSPYGERGIDCRCENRLCRRRISFIPTLNEIKIAETSLAVADGADDKDVVINVGKFF